MSNKDDINKEEQQKIEKANKVGEILDKWRFLQKKLKEEMTIEALSKYKI